MGHLRYFRAEEVFQLSEWPLFLLKTRGKILCKRQWSSPLPPCWNPKLPAAVPQAAHNKISTQSSRSTDKVMCWCTDPKCHDLILFQGMGWGVGKFNYFSAIKNVYNTVLFTSITSVKRKRWANRCAESHVRIFFASCSYLVFMYPDIHKIIISFPVCSCSETSMHTSSGL